MFSSPLSVVPHLIPAMSLSPLQSGTYQIFNVLYSTQDADLIYPGGVDGTIGGYQNNSDSGRMQVHSYSLSIEFHF